MAAWVWQASDLATGTPTGQLGVVSWSHEDRLNDAGSFSAELEPRNPVLDRQAIDATLAARSLIVPFRNGLPLGYAGVIWAPGPPSIAGASLLSYLDAQSLNTTLSYTATDQHTIMVGLVDWLQANDGDVQIDTSQVEASAVLRDQTWYVWEQKNIGEAFRQRADNIGGYDFDVRVEIDEAGDMIRRLRMWTPRRGRPFTANASPVFTVGRNARAIPSATANGGEMVTHVYAIGAEDGTVTTVGDAEVRHRLVGSYVRDDLLAAGYPRLVHTLDRNDVKTQTALDELAEGWAMFHGAAAIDEIVLEVDPDDVTYPWGSWDLGDDCLVVIRGFGQEAVSTLTGFDLVDSDGGGIDVGDGSELSTVTETITYTGGATLPWWPTGLEEVRRIVAHRWNVDATGERLQVVTSRPLEAVT